MSFFCLKQSRHAGKEYELVDQQQRTTESPTSRIICKVAVEENTEAANQQKPSGCCCCCQNTSSSNPTKTTAAAKQVELEDGLPRFGPCYGDDTESIKTAKEEAWEHFLSKSPKEEQSTRPGNILLGIKDIYTQARGSYTPAILNRVKKSQFQSMMMIDGCFFLQLALYILGGGELLGYPEKHVYFGKSKNGKKISQWIKAMFFVGNQIPCVVLRELMNQSFFQEVIAKGIPTGILVNPPSDDLCTMALYLLVVSPEIKKITGGKSSSSFHFYPLMKQVPYIRDDPSDLLHALHSLVLGPGDDPTDFPEPEDVYDLEAGGSAEQDIDKNKVSFPSASELKQLGIKLRKADSGIRGIRFRKEWVVRAYLYIPPFTFNRNTELMLGYLKSYEIGQQLGKNKREVAAYLRLMRDLIQSDKDVKILEDRNILKVEERDHEEVRDRLPGILSRFVSSDQETGYTQNLRLIRLQVIDYSAPPWRLVSLAVIFALVQTVFTILGYFLPRN